MAPPSPPSTFDVFSVRWASSSRANSCLCCVLFSAINPAEGSVSWARVSRQGQYGADTTTWLDPRRFNLHNIQASSDIGCAMLDIMVPPYDKYVMLCLRSVMEVLRKLTLPLICLLLQC